MRHCDRCDVEIADEINNCPLCGRNIASDDSTQSFVCYPDNKIWVSKRNAIINFLFWFAVIGTAISIGIELLIFHRFQYNWYIVTGLALFVLDIIMPIKFRWSFSHISWLVGVSICLYILFLELFLGGAGWGHNYVIPLFILFMSLYSTFIMALRNYYKGGEFVVCLIIFAILGTAIFIYNYVSKNVVWPSLVAFLVSVTCLIFFVIFKFRKIKQALEKSFFI